MSVSESGCPYGYRKSVVPHGRYELSVRLGDKVTDIRDFEEVVFRFGLWGDYNVEVTDEKLIITLEQYAADAASVSSVAEGVEEAFGIKAEVNLQPWGMLTPYREVRVTKPILKLRDSRSTSTQQVPEYL